MSKFYVFLEDQNESIIDPNYDSYNPGTQEVLSVIDDMDGEFESLEHYKNLVNDLEKCKNGDQVDDIMYDYGTDFVDELKIGQTWMDIMFPRAEKSEYLNYEEA